MLSEFCAIGEERKRLSTPVELIAELAPGSLFTLQILLYPFPCTAPQTNQVAYSSPHMLYTFLPLSLCHCSFYQHDLSLNTTSLRPGFPCLLFQEACLDHSS